jgi:3-phenylpropionate/trans-cinnamate dioxygenase ferredoxin subunit
MCRVICPRHGSAFDLETGTPRSLPAYEPVQTYPVVVEDGVVKVQVA